VVPEALRASREVDMSVERGKRGKRAREEVVVE
jgi:hypothetical protein